MRKLLSVIVALNIVLLSSMPMVPLASACPPAHDSAMQAMEDMCGMADEGMRMHRDAQYPAMHAHVPADQACIECGCGCNDSIDSLPHMLAPHSPDTASVSCEPATQRVDALSQLRPESRILPALSPPPRSI